MAITIELRRTQLTILCNHNQIFDLQQQPLNLCDEFQAIWQGLYPEYLSRADEVVFNNLDGGFTDTRIVMIWLRTLAMFVQDVKITKQDSGGLSVISDTIGYNSQPKIGQKI